MTPSEREPATLKGQLPEGLLDLALRQWPENGARHDVADFLRLLVGSLTFDQRLALLAERISDEEREALVEKIANATGNWGSPMHHADRVSEAQAALAAVLSGEKG